MEDNSFSFEYQPGTIHYGSGVVAMLESVLEVHDCSRALVVTDANMVEVPEVIDPVKAGIGDGTRRRFRRRDPREVSESRLSGCPTRA